MRVALFSLILLSALALSACGENFSASLPTAPSAVAVPTASTRSTPITAQAFEPAFEVSGMPLSWEMADGCLIQKPALSSSLFGTMPESTKVVQSELLAQWVDPLRPYKEKTTCMGSMHEIDRERHFVVAIFVQKGTQWQYCRWESLSWHQNELIARPCPEEDKGE